MKTLEQLAREAGLRVCSQPITAAERWNNGLAMESLASFRAACRAEALEEAAQRLDADPERMAFAAEFATVIREMK